MNELINTPTTETSLEPITTHVPQIVEYKGRRVLTTAQLAEGYGTTNPIISNNFKRNEGRYEEDKHFFVLSGEAKKDFCNRHQIDDGSKNAAVLYLWTEHGALLHAKSLGTDQAWAVYEQLVETYFRAQNASQQPLSPTDLLELQVKALREIERKGEENAKAIEATNARIDQIKDTITLDTRSWRGDCNNLIIRIAQAMGGNEFISAVRTDIFQLVDSRAGASLKRRLQNMRQRMADEGVSKSRREKLNRLDVIAGDKRLIEIYAAIVKEMAVKYLEPKGAVTGP